jgi:hypothetical protein
MLMDQASTPFQSRIIPGGRIHRNFRISHNSSPNGSKTTITASYSHERFGESKASASQERSTKYLAGKEESNEIQVTYLSGPNRTGADVCVGVSLLRFTGIRSNDSNTGNEINSMQCIAVDFSNT